MKYVSVLVTVVIALCTGSLRASADTMIDGHRSVDPAMFSVKTLRLGMSAEEVQKRLTSLMHDQPNARISQRTFSCTQDTIDDLRAGKVPFGGKCIGKVAIAGLTYRLEANFVEDMPKAPGHVRLWYIDFEPALRTAAERDAFIDGVIATYGKPTNERRRTSGRIIAYCPVTRTQPNCDLDSAWNLAFRQLTADGANGSLMLIDARYSAKHRAAVQAAIRAAQIRTYPFWWPFH